MALLKKINDFLSNLAFYLCSVLMAVYTLLVFLQVLSRNVIRISVPWCDEMALVFFGWSVFLGASIGLHKKTHYVIDFFPRSLVRMNRVMDLAADFFALVIIVLMLWAGSIFTKMGLRRAFSSIIVPQAWLFVCMPISAAFMVLFSIENIVTDAQKCAEAFKAPAPGALKKEGGPA
ncbi:MAG: TRAP transporter small permease [Spirochaetaceae bacterium]|jgi:TRAP-type C4-dicarboxylate transport system permease small subunit|nr:TRAP transporter small permease [Spirochaetaceae bacterium]